MLALRLTPPERCLVVGTSRERLRFARKLRRRASIEVVGSLPLEEERRVDTQWPGPERRQGDRSVEDLEQIIALDRIQRVVILPGDVPAETMLDSVGRAKACGVKVSILPRLFEVVGSAVEFDDFEGTTVLGVRRFGLSRSSLLIKRGFDGAGAAFCLLLLAPLFIVIALAIRLTSPGPVFFRQTRMGRHGRPFQMLKFRSMVDGAEAQRAALAHLNETDGLFKISADPRVTPVGRLLRRTSLDELPQLINVLTGEMSLVGPRPLVLEEDSLVEGRHRGRLHLVPGITGPWQLLGPVRVPLREMVVIDYLYGANWSLWTDVKILLRTCGHVLRRGGV
jgi:exopolysaccharide biosynthesis polyprenyl glycosylphosphotransferase